MSTFTGNAYRNAAIRLAVLAAIAGGCASASAAALPVFTLNPSAIGGSDGAFQANNIIVSDYSTVTLNGTSFAESGVLAVASFELNDTIVTPTGLNHGYGLYFTFSGSGTTSAGNPTSVATNGSFTSLTYQLHEYNGTATFSPSGAVVSGTSSVIAGGSLMDGTVSTSPLGGSFQANAGADLSFIVAPAGAGFFQSPVPFYNLSQATFTNGPNEITPTATGFTITNGGGSVNFASSVPEPSTYGLLLAGLGVMGFVARRRKA